ncbi:START domain-containing protein [Dyadobacter psychrotolerans]|uniref:Lipid-binding protein n=1 Tax=Dyadobacter psychrotolerans TaxID=2541721 RepID=A0A4R5DA86_9BACT|nr:START domain-containing protein [Dyadobacter psychrotolerans]TDE10542.1 lipid-binding protein [Dyadobacter psychrotolerans]
MYKTFSIFFYLLFQVTLAAGQGKWQLITEKQGTKVYSKEVANSKIKAIKAECVLNSSASQLVTLLMDVPVAEQWVFHTKSCVLVKIISPSELYYYSEVSLPWPLENRDFVARIRVTQDPVTKIITVDAPAVPGWVPVKKDLVRISHSVGLWIITPLDKEHVKLEYSLQVDPGGVLPAWLVNAFAAQGPLESFKAMKEHLLLPKYKNASLPFITN